MSPTKLAVVLILLDLAYLVLAVKGRRPDRNAVLFIGLVIIAAAWIAVWD